MSCGTTLENVLARCRVKAAPEITGSPSYVMVLENIQKFALRIATKQYYARYEILLDTFQLPSLENRRSFLSLCTFFSIVNDFVYFPPLEGTPKPLQTYHPHRHHHRRALMVPFANHATLFSTFLSKCAKLWNNLPHDATQPVIYILLSYLYHLYFLNVFIALVALVY